MFRYLPRKVKWITKPRYFTIERDKVDMVVRHRYRRQLWVATEDNISQAILDLKLGDEKEVAEVKEGDKWMPYNRVGYPLFNHDFPNIFENIVCLPPGKTNTRELRLTASADRYGQYMSPAQQAWWDKLLNGLDTAQATICPICAEHRVTMKSNGRSKADNKEQNKAKQKTWKTAYKAMNAHLAAVSYAAGNGEIIPGHELFDAPRLTPNFEMRNGINVSLVKERARADNIMTKTEQAFMDKMDLVEKEGITGKDHYVGEASAAKGPASRDARRNWNGLDEGKVVVYRTEVKGDEDPPFGVGLVQNIIKNERDEVQSLQIIEMDNDKCERNVDSTYRLYYRNENHAKPRQYLTIENESKRTAGFVPQYKVIEGVNVADWGPVTKMVSTKYTLHKRILQNSISDCFQSCNSILCFCHNNVY